VTKSKEENTDSIRNYSVETYAIFLNVDESILNLNPYIEKMGYMFISFDLKDLEQNFFDLISFPKDFKSLNQVIVDNNKFAISQEFYQAITNHELFGFHFLKEEKTYFLKRIKNIVISVVNGKQKSDKLIKEFEEIRKFTDDLINQFRLFKKGDVFCPMKFQISADTKKIIVRGFSHTNKISGSNKFELPKNEIKSFMNSFEINFTPNNLTELSISNFFLSYEISDLKTKYITLMTCLESLFNQGREQITHTVSRHLSLIISKSESEFSENYYRIKELYKIRSAIVHGSTPKENLSKATEDLQNKVRLAINHCLSFKGNKKQLFDKLNSLGFSNNKQEYKGSG